MKKYVLALCVFIAAVVLMTYVSMYAETHFYIRLSLPPLWLGVPLILVSLILTLMFYVRIYDMGVHGRDMETGERVSVYPKWMLPALWVMITLGFVGMPLFLRVLRPSLDLPIFGYYSMELYYALFTVSIISGEYLLIVTLGALLAAVAKNRKPPVE